MKTKITALSSLLFFITFTSCTSFFTPSYSGKQYGIYAKGNGCRQCQNINKCISKSCWFCFTKRWYGFLIGNGKISQSHTFKKSNIPHGVFAYAGKASGGDNDNGAENLKNYLPRFKKSISGVGLRFSAGLHNTLGGKFDGLGL
jgi:hypothetical protein